MPIQPLRYTADMEKPEPDEAATRADLARTMVSINEKTWADGQQEQRSVHAKNHGIMTGRLTIGDALEPEYRQGVFAKPATYDVVLRLSTTPGDLLDDKVSTPRGLVIKIKGVAGERLPGSEAMDVQDFLFVNAPAFQAPTAKQFLSSLKPLAATTDKVPGLKKALSATLRGVEHVIEAVGGKSALVINSGGHPLTHPLGETFYTTVPFLYGPYMAKLSLAPASPALKALYGQKVDLDGKPDGLHEAVVKYFAAQAAEWDIRVQLRTNPDTMPLEDASVEWPEDESPYVTVGRIRVEPQGLMTEDQAKAAQTELAFAPWHGIAAHRPLGSINRCRTQAYDASAKFRHDHAGACPFHHAMKA